MLISVMLEGRYFFVTKISFRMQFRNQFVKGNLSRLGQKENFIMLQNFVEFFTAKTIFVNSCLGAVQNRLRHLQKLSLPRIIFCKKCLQISSNLRRVTPKARIHFASKTVENKF